MHTKTILIADDEEQTLFCASLAMKMKGYETVLADNGETALQAILEHQNTLKPIDLMVCDVQMPRLTGEELIGKLNDLKIKVPTLVVSGFGDKEMVVRLMRLGCEDFVDKPFSPEVLLKRVEAILHASSEKTLEKTRQERLALLGEKTTEIVHDMNNILAVTIGSAESALRKIESDHPVKKRIENVMAASCRAAEICKGLLAKSKGTGGSFRVATEVTSLVQRMGVVLQDVSPEGVQVTAAAPKEPVWLKADSERLQQAIMNLGFNAFTAMPEGGTLAIKISVENAFPPQQFGPVRQCAVFTVADTGKGMSHEVFVRIFKERFTTNHNGHGMGLFCVRTIIEDEHHGWIDVHTQEHQGTTFKLYLPME